MSTLEDMIASLKSLSSANEKIANAAAPKMEAALRAQVAAGVDPNGKAWVPKKDGSRPLANAADHVHATSSGDVVTLTVDGPEYFHQTAKAGGRLPQRKLIPSVGDALPPSLQSAADQARDEVLSQLTGAT